MQTAEPATTTTTATTEQHIGQRSDHAAAQESQELAVAAIQRRKAVGRPTDATAAATTATTTAAEGWTRSEQPSVAAHGLAAHSVVFGHAHTHSAASVGLRNVFRRRIAFRVVGRRLRIQQFLGGARLPRSEPATSGRFRRSRRRLRTKSLRIQDGGRGAHLHVDGRFHGFHEFNERNGRHVRNGRNGRRNGHVSHGHVHGRNAFRLPVTQPVARRLPRLRSVRSFRWIRRRRSRRRHRPLLQQRRHGTPPLRRTFHGLALHGLLRTGKFA